VRPAASYEHHFYVIISSLFEFYYELQHDEDVKSLDELLGLLKTVEEDMNKGFGNVLAVSSAGKKIKKHSKCKSKGKVRGRLKW
jgi:hypothetical protein